MPFESRYSPGNVIEVLNKSPHLFGKKPHINSGGVNIFSYYENESCIVLSPSTDTEKNNAQMIQTISQGLIKLAENKNLQSKKIIIPVAEEQKILWIFKRNHWVSLHYDPKENRATVLDSRPWLVSFLYPMKAMKNELKTGIKALFGAKKAQEMHFDKKYQGVQHNDIYCGAWTSRNILDLSGESGNCSSIDEQETRYSPKDEQTIILRNMQLVGYQAKEGKSRFGVLENLMFWLGLKEKPALKAPVLKDSVFASISPALTELQREIKVSKSVRTTALSPYSHDENQKKETLVNDFEVIEEVDEENPLNPNLF
jgi:hypothetical protein